MKEHELWDIVENYVAKPTKQVGLVAYEKTEITDQRVIMDAIKVHLIPHVVEKATTHTMYKALTDLLQGDNVNKKMVLTLERQTKRCPDD